MGYEVFYKPQDVEWLKEQVSKITDSTDAETLKLELLMQMLINEDITVRTLIFRFRLYINLLYEIIKKDIFQSVIKEFEEKGEFFFCGRKFAGETELSLEDIKSQNVTKFAILKRIVPTEDYFKEGTTFHDKVAEIEEFIESVIDDLNEIVFYEIMDHYKDIKEESY